MNSLEKQVLKTIGENTSDPDVFLDTDAGLDPIRDSLNDAVQELCMVTGAYQIKYYLSLIANSWLYRLELNTDYFGYVVQVIDRARRYRLEQTDLIKLGQLAPEWMQDTGDPTHYYYIGYNMLGIYPTPSSDGRVLEMDCVAIPKPYEDGSAIVKLRANYERAAVYYAVSDFYASRGDAKRATEYYNQYLGVAQLMKLRPQTTEQQYRAGGNGGS